MGVHFDSIPPPPFAQVDGGGCYREKFFYFFLIPLSTRPDYTSILIFARNLMNGFLPQIIFLVLYSFDYDLDLLHIVVNYGFDYNFGFCIFRFYISTRILIFIFFIFSTRFSSHQFRLVSALSILCFNFSACYKQTSMLIWVCFMLILAILRLSDVFSSVLGVVYRLGIK